MSRRILLIDGHPDPDPWRFGHALVTAYELAARNAGHATRRIDLASLSFELIRSRLQWESGHVPTDIEDAQGAIGWSDHLVIVYPLWLGDMPALLKGFLEQVMRPGFALREVKGKLPERCLTGRSARLVVTMGMPALFYRAIFGAHSVKSFERNILKLSGVSPVAHTLIGSVESDAAERQRWLGEMAALGRRGE